MAIHYVFSGATGSNNGTSWANAWTSIASAVSVAAGDEVRVHKTHSESLSGFSISFSNGTVGNPVKIVCVDKDAGDAPSTGATITHTISFFQVLGHLIVEGLTIESPAELFLSIGGGGHVQTWRNCQFVRAGDGTGETTFAPATGASVLLENCTVDNSGAPSVNLSFRTIVAATFVMRGGSVIGRTGQSVYGRNSSNARQTFEGVKFEPAVSALLFSSSGTGTVVFRGCEFPGTSIPQTFSTGADGVQGSVLLESCAAGSLAAAPLGLTRWETHLGRVSSVLSRYRTGGADDGEQANPHCWEIVTSSLAADRCFALETPPIARWVDAGNHTLTIRLASDLTLQDDEFWIEVLSPSEAGSPTSQARLQSTRCQPVATPANLTADGSSTWNGSNVSVAQEISVSIAPAVAGMVMVRCCLARPSTTVYVDPLIEVS